MKVSGLGILFITLFNTIALAAKPYIAIVDLEVLGRLGSQHAGHRFATMLLPKLIQESSVTVYFRSFKRPNVISNQCKKQHIDDINQMVCQLSQQHNFDVIVSGSITGFGQYAEATIEVIDVLTKSSVKLAPVAVTVQGAEQSIPEILKAIRQIKQQSSQKVGNILGDKQAFNQRQPKTIFRHYLKDGTPAPEMIIIEAGRFDMGDENGVGSRFEQPVHRINIDKVFAVSRYEITFQEYDKFALSTGRTRPNDFGMGRDRWPVVGVNWKDAKAYVKWLSEQTGENYRLLSEAEWEYIAKAGSETNYWWGNDKIKAKANCKQCRDSSDFAQTSVVGEYPDNAFGIFDTAGNVAEWVEDCWFLNYIGAPNDGTARVQPFCLSRTIRGGSWQDNFNDIRSSARKSAKSRTRDNTIGFRIAVDL